MIRRRRADLPIFGVCLGQQAIGEAFGGTVIHAATLMHGKTSPITHDGRGSSPACPRPFTATRYHSLAVERDSLPDCLEVTAWTDDGEIMGLRHRERPIFGVQFHPGVDRQRARPRICWRTSCGSPPEHVGQRSSLCSRASPMARP